MNGWLDTEGKFYVITCSHTTFAEQLNESEDSMISKGWIKVQKIIDKFQGYGINPLVTYNKINSRQFNFLHDGVFEKYKFQIQGDHKSIPWYDFIEKIDKEI